MLLADYPEHNHKTFLTVYLCCVVNPKVRFQGFEDDSFYRAQVFDRDHDGDNDFYMNNDDDCLTKVQEIQLNVLARLLRALPGLPYLQIIIIIIIIIIMNFHDHCLEHGAGLLCIIDVEGE